MSRRLLHNIWGKLLLPVLAASYCTVAQAQQVITKQMIADANVKRGELVSLRCRACHTLGKGEPNKQGPNLYHIFYRHVGEKKDFHYSQALQNEHFMWTPDKLNEWLSGPKKFVPGNNMNFPGLPREEDRINLIAFLIQKTGGLPDNGSTGPGETTNATKTPDSSAKDDATPEAAGSAPGPDTGATPGPSQGMAPGSPGHMMPGGQGHMMSGPNGHMMPGMGGDPTPQTGQQ